MPVQLIMCSHSPLMRVELEDSQGDAQARFLQTMAQVAAELKAFAPDLILSFGPDHFNGFFYDLMPAFCIGTRAEGTQDWNMPGGALRIPGELADGCARHLHRQGFDIAISHDMRVDHGTTISLTQVAGSLDRYPVLPIFINCAADPRPSMARVRALGVEIGRFLRGLQNQTGARRIAVLGSGGLSHDPPTPRLGQVSEEVARRLVRRAVPTAEDLRKREARVVQAAKDLVRGAGPCQPPDPAWDAEFLRKIVQWDTHGLDAIDDAELDARAGFGGHEVRTWSAASAAARALVEPGELQPATRYYQVIPEWLTGMGVVTARA